MTTLTGMTVFLEAAVNQKQFARIADSSTSGPDSQSQHVKSLELI